MAQLIVTSVDADPSIRIRLRGEFKRLDLTVEQVALASKIPKATLDNILSGRVASMKDVHLSAICLAFPAIEIAYVLTGVHNAEVMLYRTTLNEIREKASEGLGG